MPRTIPRSVLYVASATFVDAGKNLDKPFIVSTKETIPSDNSSFLIEDYVRDIPPTGTPDDPTSPTTYHFDLSGDGACLAFPIENWRRNRSARHRSSGTASEQAGLPRLPDF